MIKVYTIANDTDNGTDCTVYPSEEERDNAWEGIILSYWDDNVSGGAFPEADTYQKKWDVLTEKYGVINSHYREEHELDLSGLLTGEEMIHLVRVLERVKKRHDPRFPASEGETGEPSALRKVLDIIGVEYV